MSIELSATSTSVVPAISMAADSHNSPLTSNLSDLVATADRLRKEDAARKISQYQFQIDDLPFYVRHDKELSEQQLQIWAVLGYMPFSAESPERRRLLTTALEATRNLKLAKFGISDRHQIIVSTLGDMKTVHRPDFIFTTFIPFYEEARPYIQLIGQYL